MRQIIVSGLGPVDALVIQEAEAPQCANDEVLIDVAYCGVGGIDAIMRRGDLGALNPQPPFVPGLEVSGTVRAIGEAVTSVSAGDRVSALLMLNMGGYAEQVLCKADSIVGLPPNVPLEAGASLVNPITALTALKLAGASSAQTLVIHGAAGGLGSAIARIARVRYPETRLIGTVHHADKKPAALEAGCQQALTVEEFQSAAGTEQQYPAILDPVGGSLRQASIQALAPGGTIILLGNASNDPDGTIDGQAAWLKALRAQGLNLGLLHSLDPEAIQQAGQAVVTMAADGLLDLAPTRIFPFDDAVQAHRFLESAAGYGRVVLATKSASEEAR